MVQKLSAFFLPGHNYLPINLFHHGRKKIDLPESDLLRGAFRNTQSLWNRRSVRSLTEFSGLILRQYNHYNRVKLTLLPWGIIKEPSLAIGPISKPLLTSLDLPVLGFLAARKGQSLSLIQYPKNRDLAFQGRLHNRSDQGALD